MSIIQKLHAEIQRLFDDAVRESPKNDKFFWDNYYIVYCGQESNRFDYEYCEDIEELKSKLDGRFSDYELVPARHEEEDLGAGEFFIIQGKEFRPKCEKKYIFSEGI